MKKKPDFDFSEFDWGWLVESLLFNGTFLLGAVLLFFKTADLAAAFAPHQIMGYEGIETYYGIAVAVIVEGAFVASKFTIARSNNPLAFVWNVLLIFIPFLLSAFAQVIDGFVVRETLASQPEEIQLLVNYGVPLIPAFVVALVLAKSVFDALPANVLARLRKKSANSVGTNPKE